MLFKIVACNSPASPDTKRGELARTTPSANGCFAHAQISGNIIDCQDIWEILLLVHNQHSFLKGAPIAGLPGLAAFGCWRGPICFP
jgi:hypothetical protein